MVLVKYKGNSSQENRLEQKVKKVLNTKFLRQKLELTFFYHLFNRNTNRKSFKNFSIIFNSPTRPLEKMEESSTP